MKITIELSAEALAVLDTVAQSEGRNRSFIVERIIRETLAEPNPMIEAKKIGRPRKIVELEPVDVAPFVAGGGAIMPLPEYGSLSSAILDHPEVTIEGERSYKLRLWKNDLLVSEESVYLEASKVDDAAAKWAASMAAKLDPEGTASFEVEIVEKED